MGLGESSQYESQVLNESLDKFLNSGDNLEGKEKILEGLLNSIKSAEQIKLMNLDYLNKTLEKPNILENLLILIDFIISNVHEKAKTINILQNKQYCVDNIEDQKSQTIQRNDFKFLHHSIALLKKLLFVVNNKHLHSISQLFWQNSNQKQNRLPLVIRLVEAIAVLLFTEKFTVKVDQTKEKPQSPIDVDERILWQRPKTMYESFSNSYLELSYNKYKLLEFLMLMICLNRNKKNHMNPLISLLTNKLCKNSSTLFHSCFHMAFLNSSLVTHTNLRAILKLSTVCSSLLLMSVSYKCSEKGVSKLVQKSKLKNYGLKFISVDDYIGNKVKILESVLKTEVERDLFSVDYNSYIAEMGSIKDEVLIHNIINNSNTSLVSLMKFLSANKLTQQRNANFLFVVKQMYLLHYFFHFNQNWRQFVNSYFFHDLFANILSMLAHVKDLAENSCLFAACAFILAKFSEEREFVIGLNRTYERKVEFIIDFKDFEGTYADYFIFVIYDLLKQTTKHLSTCDSLLALVLLNASPYFNDISITSSEKLIQLCQKYSSVERLKEGGKESFQTMMILYQSIDHIIRNNSDGNHFIVAYFMKNKYLREKMSTLKDTNFEEDFLHKYKEIETKISNKLEEEKILLNSGKTIPIEENETHSLINTNTEEEEEEKATKQRMRLNTITIEANKIILEMELTSTETNTKIENADINFIKKESLSETGLSIQQNLVERYNKWNEYKFSHKKQIHKIDEFLEETLCVGLVPYPTQTVSYNISFSKSLTKWIQHEIVAFTLRKYNKKLGI